MGWPADIWNATVGRVNPDWRIDDGSSSAGNTGGSGNAPPNPLEVGQQILNRLNETLPAIGENLGKLLLVGDELKSAIANKTPDLAPADPVAVLKQISESLTTAENTLNQHGLVIASGTVEAEIFIKTGDVAGARAKFTLNITPKPIT